MKTIFTSVLLLTLLIGCTKNIDVQLRSAPSQIVIQGTITNGGDPYYIRINRTVPFDAENTYPAVSGAGVYVLDSTDNKLYRFYESPIDAGVYISAYLVGQMGHTYKMYVNIDGEEYIATSTMPNLVTMKGISFTQTKILEETRNLPQVNFQDPPNVKNYYVFSLLVNDVPYQAFYALDDRLSDGNFVRHQLYMDSAYIQKEDVVKVIMANVDRNIYNYFNVLQANGGTSGTPSNPPSNISNGALGYFGASSVDVRSIQF
ncbi:DUF4249 domain-containing protein [Chitinophaga pinensis]|uniref:DUF4249 domain-containing protein n=1 Tax=Chitinophaga pinensis (strain ATCC 43595 / DSM 2588 / LMG 13176 / NBRC 15968 / NCIMB 11800 / UQM 2034) TaxID=485918 RepID=A0A979GWL2_CHIPD|nr:DUF4249 domain-containing protein [Chitinophaga pinensis]ACU61836.1 hypothetical protein Cpin_4390 [Chitinophaga pinensis DSM 2588]